MFTLQLFLLSPTTEGAEMTTCAIILEQEARQESLTRYQAAAQEATR